MSPSYLTTLLGCLLLSHLAFSTTIETETTTPTDEIAINTDELFEPLDVSVKDGPQTVTTTPHVIEANGLIADANSKHAHFSPAAPGTYAFSVRVTDGCSSYVDEVSYEVKCEAYPQANAGEKKRLIRDCNRAVTAVLDGSDSTSNGETTYKWEFCQLPEKSDLTDADIQNADAQTGLFIPDVTGQYCAKLTIEDCCGSTSDTVWFDYECNAAPVADAGTSRSIGFKDSREGVKLDGSATSDDDGDDLKYEWSFLSKPADSNVADADIVSQGDDAQPTFYPDKAGSYVIQLQVSDCCRTKTATVVIDITCNDSPSANAGPDENITGLQKVYLDGSGSSDPDADDKLVYTWTFASKPPTSDLDDSDIVGYNVYLATFQPDKLGVYEVELTVSDCCSSARSRKKVVVGCNDAPVAIAGEDRTITGTQPFSRVDLDGCRSEDPDGDDLTYKWHLVNKPDNSNIRDYDLEGSNNCNAAFTPDKVGLYELTISVFDHCTTSNDTIRVIVGCNRFPEAHAGPDQAISFDCNPARVNLDGSASRDVDGDELDFEWRFSTVPEGSKVRDSDIDHASEKWAAFVPDVLGTYEVVLTVTDTCTRDTDKVRIVYACNHSPKASAGPDRLVTGTFPWGGDIVLDASGSSDPDSDITKYSWSLITAPDESDLTSSSIVGPHLSMPSFTPDAPGRFEFEVSVSDCCSVSTDRVAVTVSCGAAPTANAGYDQYLVQACDGNSQTVEIDGSGSYDPDGSDLVYAWRFVSVPDNGLISDADLNSASGVRTSFTIRPEHRNSHSDEYILELSVSDSCKTVTDQVKITYCCNDKPTANAGVDKSLSAAPPFPAIDLDGSASSDPNSDGLSYSWSVVSVPEDSYISDNSIAQADQPVAAFSPDQRGEYIMKITVRDCCTEVSDTVKISITCDNPPIADAGQDVTQAHFCDRTNSISLDGSGSYDPDGESLDISWSFIQVPVDSQLNDVAIVSGSSDKPSFNPDVTGQYELRITVSDGCSVVSDTVSVSYTCEGSPTANAGEETEIVANPPYPLHHLSGLGSKDPYGDILEYEWSFTSLPLGSRLTDGDIAHTTPSALGATFTPDAPGCYDVELIVEGCCARARDTTRVCVACNDAPTAKAGKDQDLVKGATLPLVTLDGCESTDPDGDSLTYGWRFTRKPSDSEVNDASIFRSTKCKPSFTPDVTGIYELELTVFDGCTPSRDKVAVHFKCNKAPTAHAGRDQNVVKDCGKTTIVELDASESADPDNDPLTYAWTFSRVPSGSTLTDSDIVGQDQTQASFTPDQYGPYELTFTVSDFCFTQSDRVQVNYHCNGAPVSNAGTDQDITAYPYPKINLFGTRSKDPDNDDISYEWHFITVPSGSHLNDDNIVDRSSNRAIFLPDVAGVYMLSLKVADCCSESTDEVKVTINRKGCNALPIVDAGSDITLLKLCNDNDFVNNEVILDGTGSYDPDGDALNYKWKFAKKPFESMLLDSDILYSNSPEASFTPDMPGDYVVLLDVTDGCSNQAQEVHISYTCNSPPQANAGDAQHLDSGGSQSLPKITVSGADSFDPDDDEISFHWTFINKAEGSCLEESKLDCNGRGECSFFPDVRGCYDLQLTVSDCCNSVSDEVEVCVTCSSAPKADAGEDITLHSCPPYPVVHLDGKDESADQDSTDHIWTWSFDTKPADSQLSDADIQNNGNADAWFVPDVMGSYTLALEIADGCSSDVDTVEVLVGCNTGPHADAGEDKSVRWDGNKFPKVVVDASASTDPDDDAISYTWKFVNQPAGSKLRNIDISNSFDAKASFWADVPGTYELEVTVADCCSPSRDRVNVHVGCNGVPTVDAGSDQSLKKNCQDTVVSVNGFAEDPEGDALAYEWKFTSIPPGSKLTNSKIVNANSITASFSPDVTGSFFELQFCVTDGCTKLCDRVKVEFECNDPPQADAGQDQTITKECTDTTVQLDGSGSHDPDNDPITYEWKFTNFPGDNAPELIGATTSAPSFTPTKVGIYEVELTVKDCCVIPELRCTCMKDRVLVTLACEGVPPTADAGEDQVINWDETKFPTAHLDGSGTNDPDGDHLTYTWTLLSKPDRSVRTDADITATGTTDALFVPDVNGRYELKLSVSDCCYTESDTVTIVVRCDNPPTTKAGPDQQLTRSCAGWDKGNGQLGSPVFLDGSGSSDPENENLECTWSFVCKPGKSQLEDKDISFKDSQVLNGFFYADVLGEYVLKLTCHDGCSWVDDDIIVNVDCNGAPVAEATAGDGESASIVQQCGANEAVILDGTASSDPDEDPLAFHWSFVSKPETSKLNDDDISGAFDAKGSFRPDVVGEYTLQLHVQDCCQSDKTQVTVSVACSDAPVADAGKGRGNDDPILWDGISAVEIALDGSATSDPDSDNLLHHWRLTDKPRDSDASDADIQVSKESDGLTATFSPDNFGCYTFELEVNDCCTTATASVTHCVQCSDATTADAGDNQTVEWECDAKFPLEVSIDSEEHDGITYEWSLEAYAPLNQMLNHVPTVDAGCDYEGTVGSIVHLDQAQANDDDDGDNISYTWSLLEHPSGSVPSDMVKARHNRQAFFTPDAAGLYVFELAVTDGTSTVTDTASVLASASNHAAFLGKDEQTTSDWKVISYSLMGMLAVATLLVAAICVHFRKEIRRDIRKLALGDNTAEATSDQTKLLRV